MLCFEGNNALILISAGPSLPELTALPDPLVVFGGGEGEEGDEGESRALRAPLRYLRHIKS